MSIRLISAVTVATLAAAAGAAATTCPPAASTAVACFQLSGFAKASVETYGSMAVEVDVHWATMNSLDAWLTPTAASARALYAKTRANDRDPGLTHLAGRWVYTWATWPAPMIRSAARRCLAG